MRACFGIVLILDMFYGIYLMMNIGPLLLLPFNVNGIRLRNIGRFFLQSASRSYANAYATCSSVYIQRMSFVV